MRKSIVIWSGIELLITLVILFGPAIINHLIPGAISSGSILGSLYGSVDNIGDYLYSILFVSIAFFFGSLILLLASNSVAKIWLPLAVLASIFIITKSFTTPVGYGNYLGLGESPSSTALEYSIPFFLGSIVFIIVASVYFKLTSRKLK